MNKKNGLLRKVMSIGYLVSLAGMVLILALIGITKDDSYVSRFINKISRIDDSWTLDESGDEKADLSKLGSYINESSGQGSIYYRIPDMTKKTSLIYRTKDISTKVILDGETIYETMVAQSPFYNRSPGNLWNMVDFYPEDSGKIAEIQISITYDTKAVVLDNTYWGDRSVFIINSVREKMYAIIVSVLMILIGLLLMAINIITQRTLKDGNFGAFYLGIYAAITGIWSMLETNILQFFVKDMRIIQTMDNMVMIVGIMPLFIYLEYEYHMLNYLFTRLICLIDVVYILFCIFVQLFTTKDFHSLLLYSQLFSTIGSLMVLVWVFIECRHQWKQSHHLETGLILKVTGISVLMIISTFILFKYTKEDVADRAELIRYGMFVFIMCFCASYLLETYKLIANGLRYDIVKSLAYIDGLTGLGNRTAYLEQLDKYAKNNIPQLGIVFMDINNLKTVNDNMGHEEGDGLIKTAAQIIQETFGKVGNVYRIGGDEFCALVANVNSKQVYKEALHAFKRSIYEHNKTGNCKTKLQIAQGFAICENATMESIEITVSDADKAMYSDKERQKGLSAQPH